jgi:LacI family transcriptional regulator
MISDRKATIYDVAKTANVSVGTVSRYLNGQTLRQSNRDQVERAIEALSFRANSMARAIRADSTKVIGFLVREIDEFHGTLLEKLSRQFQASGYKIMTYCHDERQEEVMDAVDYFAGQRVDALIMGGAPEAAAAVRRIIEENIPVITYNNDVLGMNVDRVFVDNQNAAARAVSHLIDLGHTRIAHIAGRQDVSTGVARREGYVTALRRAGIDLEDALIEQGNWHVDGGYAASARLMHLERPPTAIFTANYLMAVGVLEGARDHGWSIPDTFSLVSFDDTQLFRFYPEGISAISQPVDEIAKSIVETTLARLQGAEVAATTTRTIQCNLILRGSTRPPVRR